jgi:hypothetical protein
MDTSAPDSPMFLNRFAAQSWPAQTEGETAAMMLAGSTPDELNTAIMADCASRSQP